MYEFVSSQNLFMCNKLLTLIYVYARFVNIKRFSQYKTFTAFKNATVKYSNRCNICGDQTCILMLYAFLNCKQWKLLINILISAYDFSSLIFR